MSRLPYLRREINESLMLSLMNSTSKSPDTLKEIIDRYGSSFTLISNAFKDTFATTPARYRDRIQIDGTRFSHIYNLGGTMHFTSEAVEQDLFEEGSLDGVNDVPMIYRVSRICVIENNAQYEFDVEVALIDNEWVCCNSPDGRYLVTLRPNPRGESTTLEAFICMSNRIDKQVPYAYELSIDIHVDVLARVPQPLT